MGKLHLRSRLQAVFPGRDNGGRRLQQLTQTEVDADAMLEDPWRMGFYDVKMRFWQENRGILTGDLMWSGRW